MILIDWHHIILIEHSDGTLLLNRHWIQRKNNNLDGSQFPLVYTIQQIAEAELNAKMFLERSLIINKRRAKVHNRTRLFIDREQLCSFVNWRHSITILRKLGFSSHIFSIFPQQPKHNHALHLDTPTSQCTTSFTALHQHQSQFLAVVYGRDSTQSSVFDKLNTRRPLPIRRV